MLYLFIKDASRLKSILQEKLNNVDYQLYLYQIISEQKGSTEKLLYAFMKEQRVNDMQLLLKKKI